MCDNEYYQADSNVDRGKNKGGNFHFHLSVHFTPPRGHFLGHFYLLGPKKKYHPKLSKKISKMYKNILRTMVKTPAQTDGWLKSYGQKTG